MSFCVCSTLSQERRSEASKKGLYALVNPSTRNVFVNKFQIASHLSYDSFFSYREALEYYGIANQSFVFFYVSDSCTCQQCWFWRRNLSFEEKQIWFRNIRSYQRGRRTCCFFGTRHRGPDRCPSLVGGLEKIEYALDNCRKLKIDKTECCWNNFDKAF